MFYNHEWFSILHHTTIGTPKQSQTLLHVLVFPTLQLVHLTIALKLCIACIECQEAKKSLKFYNHMTSFFESKMNAAFFILVMVLQFFFEKMNSYDRDFFLPYILLQ